MSTDALKLDPHVFENGPPLRLQRLIGLVEPGRLRVGKRALLAAVIAWVPLAVLALTESILTSRSVAQEFFSDLGVYGRYLLAVPFLVLAEGDCIPRFENVVRHFVDSGLVVDSDMGRYRHAVTSTQRFLNSIYDEIIVLVLAYAVVVAVLFYLSVDLVPPWQRGNSGHLSAAGWWHILISVPLLLVLIIGWLLRLVMWGRFLFLMSRLDLHLLPSHPDHVGGLKFVSTSLRGFRFISFALAAIVAGGVGNRVLYHGSELKSFKNLVIVLIVLILLLSAGPLTVFVRRLRQAKKQGIFEYGALANRFGGQFESKWLTSKAVVDPEILTQPDFSATTDFYSVVANVYEMRDVPFKAKDLIAPVLPAVVPFIAVALLTIPFQLVIDTLIKLLM